MPNGTNGNGAVDVVAQLSEEVNRWLSGTDQGGQAGTQAGTLNAQLISNVLPPIDLSGAGGGLGGRLLTWIQPTIVGALPVVGTVNIAPYGVANPAIGTLVFYTVLGLAVYGAYKLFR